MSVRYKLSTIKVNENSFLNKSNLSKAKEKEVYTSLLIQIKSDIKL